MEHENRIGHLQDKIAELELCGSLLFYSRDIYYYTGTAQPSYLVVMPDDFFLFVRSGFEFAVDDVFIEKDKMKEQRQLKEVYKDVFSDLHTRSGKIATELDVLPAMEFFEFSKIFSEYELVDVSPIILEQRKRKDAFEIGRIKRACEVIDMGHKAVLSTLKRGVTELELAAAVENAHRLGGHEGVFFVRHPDFFMSRGPISSGPNLFKISGVVYTITGVGLSPSVPAGPSQRRIENGDLVIVDVPVLVDGYHADQTRTYVLGKANESVKNLHDCLREIADHLIECIRPGTRCNEIYQMAIERSKELGVANSFLNLGRGTKTRLIGHGVGLELNEPPILSEYDRSVFTDGCVLALDMHVMDEDVGVVKLEDMILVNQEKNEILTRSPRQIFEILRR